MTEPAVAHRLFFALWPNEDVRAALAQAVDRTPALRDAGRAVPASMFHLTLHFLGGWAVLPEAALVRAREAAAALPSRAFHLIVDRAGGFANARVGWLAPSGNSGLDALWSDLRHALDGHGVAYRAHDAFAPHVTVRRSVRGRLDDVTIDPISWPVDAFVLVHSHAGRYDVLDRWSLDA